MPLVIQNDESSNRLQRQFRIVGRTPVVLDEVIVPTADVGDFNGASPFEARVTGSDGVTSPAGGALAYSGVLLTPGAGKVVAVESFHTWPTAGASATYYVTLMRPVDVAAVTVTSATQAIGRTNGVILSTGFVAQVASTYSLFHHTATIGGVIGRLYVSSPGMAEFLLARARPIVLDGTDPRGPISLALQHSVANTGLNCGFHFSEYSQ